MRNAVRKTINERLGEFERIFREQFEKRIPATAAEILDTSTDKEREAVLDKMVRAVLKDASEVPTDDPYLRIMLQGLVRE